MILIDTNIISEVMKPTPDARVARWVERIDGNDLFTTVISEGEIWSGLMTLPVGRRRDALIDVANDIFDIAFRGQIISFDRFAARAYRNVMARRRAAGRPIQTADAMIAAIAIAHSFAVATRNVRDFEDTGASAVNPFEDEP